MSKLGFGLGGGGSPTAPEKKHQPTLCLPVFPRCFSKPIHKLTNLPHIDSEGGGIMCRRNINTIVHIHAGLQSTNRSNMNFEGYVYLSNHFKAMQWLISVFGSRRTFRHEFQVDLVYIVGLCWLWHLTTGAVRFAIVTTSSFRSSSGKISGKLTSPR
jgi:hypothetical protein